MNKREYEAHVTELAKNGLDHGESPRSIAEVAIVATENVGDRKAVCYSAEPFARTRLWPKDVIGGRDHELMAHDPDDLRKLAVELLKRDIYDAMMGIENDTVTGL